jgi:hypothetical protein
MKILQRLMTKNLKEIPLFWVHFNYEHFKNSGKENSCMVNIHPILADDKFIQDKLKDVIDYIRDSYDLEEL